MFSLKQQMCRMMCPSSFCSRSSDVQLEAQSLARKSRRADENRLGHTHAVPPFPKEQDMRDWRDDFALGKMKMSRKQQNQQEQADKYSLQMAKCCWQRLIWCHKTPLLQESRQLPKTQATSEIWSEKLIRSEKGWLRDTPKTCCVELLSACRKAGVFSLVLLMHQMQQERKQIAQNVIVK